MKSNGGKSIGDGIERDDSLGGRVFKYKALLLIGGKGFQVQGEKQLR